jgi:hypothetical protein
LVIHRDRASIKAAPLSDAILELDPLLFRGARAPDPRTTSDSSTPYFQRASFATKREDVLIGDATERRPKPPPRHGYTVVGLLLGGE